MSDTRPTLDEQIAAAAKAANESFPFTEMGEPPVPEEILKEMEEEEEEQKEKEQAALRKESGRRTAETRTPVFSEERSAEELLYYFQKGVEESREPVIMNILGKDGKRIQVEGIREEDDNAELYHGKIDPNRVADSMETINVYIDGKQVKAEEFLAFIEENKTAFVAACNMCFPDLAETVLLRDTDLTMEEKQHVLDRIDKAQPGTAVSKKPATQKDLRDSRDLSEQMKRAALVEGRQEVRYAEDRLFDSGPRVSAQFYLQGGDRMTVVEFSKFQTRNGEEKTFMKINGKSASEQEMAKLLAKHPGQIGKQVDAYLAAQKAAQERKKGKETAVPKKEPGASGPER